MPNRQGFDYFFGVPYSNDMDGYLYRNPPFQSPPLPLYENETLMEKGPDQSLLTRRYTEAAVRFIEENVNNSFFLYLAHNMPHLPLHASDAFRGTSRHGIYGDVIQEIDWSVGEILRILKENHLDKKTLVIFTSDNGPVLRENAGTAGPLRGGKATTWEGGQRVPFIVYGPGFISGNQICREMATSMDLLPTFIRLAGGDIPEDPKRDGHDISEMLFSPGEASSPYKAFYYYSRDGEPEAIRSGKWKVHIKKSRGWDMNQGSFPTSLYNLSDDIGEDKNLASEHPGLVKRLSHQISSFDSTLNKEMRPAARIKQNINTKIGREYLK
jgi:arylsulfatase A-like enzyme